jgi:hypothetical protein
VPVSNCIENIILFAAVSNMAIREMYIGYNTILININYLFLVLPAVLITLRYFTRYDSDFV